MMTTREMFWALYLKLLTMLPAKALMVWLSSWVGSEEKELGILIQISIYCKIYLDCV